MKVLIQTSFSTKITQNEGANSQLSFRLYLEPILANIDHFLPIILKKVTKNNIKYHPNIAQNTHVSISMISNIYKRKTIIVI